MQRESKVFSEDIYPGLTVCNTLTSDFYKSKKDRWGINSL